MIRSRRCSVQFPSIAACSTGEGENGKSAKIVRTNEMKVHQSHDVIVPTVPCWYQHINVPVHKIHTSALLLYNSVCEVNKISLRAII